MSSEFVMLYKSTKYQNLLLSIKRKLINMKAYSILIFITFVYLAIAEARYIKSSEDDKQIVIETRRLRKRSLLNGGDMSSSNVRSQGINRGEVRTAGNSKQNFVDSLIGSGTSIRI